MSVYNQKTKEGITHLDMALGADKAGDSSKLASNAMLEPVPGGGMYGQNPRVEIGNLSISDNGNGKVWIEEADGIGGEFSKEMFDAHVQTFFNKYF